MINFRQTNAIPATAVALLFLVTGCSSQFKNGFKSLMPKGQLFNNASLEANSMPDRDPYGSGTSNQTRKDQNVAPASFEGQLDSFSELTWHESFEDAQNESSRTGKPILADFTGSNWCSYCVKLKKEVFATPQFKQWASKNVVLLELDFPRPSKQPQWLQRQNQQLKERYQISRYPTVLLLSPSGSVMGQVGYMNDADKWIAVAENSIATHQSLQSAEFIDATDMKSYR